MKAVQLLSYGKNLRKHLKVNEIEIPQPKTGEVLIRIKAASLNPVDYKMVYGNAKIIHHPKKPYSLGFDCAGIVETSDDTSRFNIEDEVYSRVPLELIGTFAEYICLPTSCLAIKPKNMSFQEASSIPLVGGTVLQSFKYFNIEKGSKILIHAGSGGVGTFAIQYAKHLGAEVFTTTSTKNVQWVKALGADHVIDYKKQDYKNIVPKLDFIYDTLGNQYIKEGIKLIKPNGVIVSIAGYKDQSTLKRLGIPSFIRAIMTLNTYFIKRKLAKINANYKYVLMETDAVQLQHITELIEQGAIKATIDKEYSLDDAVEAFCYLETGRAKGKVVLVP